MGCRTFFPTPHGLWGPVERSINWSNSKESLWLVGRRTGGPRKIEKEGRREPLGSSCDHLLGTSRKNWETFYGGTEIKRHRNLNN